MFRRKIKDIQEHAKNRGISMERRLFLYWLIMVLAVMAAVFVVLIVAECLAMMPEAWWNAFGPAEKHNHDV